MTPRLRWFPISAALLCACGGELPPDDTADTDDLVSCRSIQWWHGYSITSNRKESYGWWDTDLAVWSSTPIQLRHASRSCGVRPQASSADMRCGARAGEA